jgi:glucose/arabinose dehydrogenase
MVTYTPSRRALLRTGATLGSLALAGCSGPTGEPTESAAEPTTGAQPTTSPAFAVETVGEGFAHPWGLAVLPGEAELLVTQRPGTLSLLDLDSGAVQTVGGTPAVFAAGQGGLLDVALDPRAGKDWVYLTYAATNGAGASATHLARGRLDRAGPALRDLSVLHVATPFVDSNAHYGSRVVFGPDEKLYVSVGDRQFKNFGPAHVAQDPSNELGTTLRLAPDGSIPADNPFVEADSAADAVYTYGHRNVQGMAVHPETGAIWQSEHGERDGDELNVLVAGENYGWPLASYACHYGSSDPVGDSPAERPEFEAPVYYWECGSGGFPPAGMAFGSGGAFPEWQGDLFVGSLAGQALARFSVAGQSVGEPERLLADRGWRIRAVEFGPESGQLYLAVDGGSAPVVKLVPG